MPRPKTTKHAATAAIAVMAIALGAGCGGSDEPSGTPESAAGGATTAPANGGGDRGSNKDGELTITAAPDGSLEFEEEELSTTPGPVTVQLRNDSSVVHDVVVEMAGKQVLATDRVTSGTAKASGKLEPGTYAFFCSVTGHRGAGMEGTLTVSSG